MPEAPAESPFVRVGPETIACPVILSVPHAGRGYSDALLKASRLPRSKLELLEDRYVDRLIWRAVADGATAFIAQAPRAEIDLNRDERELDPAMVIPAPAPKSVLPSERTRGGLGLIPSRIAGAGSIWLHRMTGAELSRRIQEIHGPYHRAIEEALREARARFGVAILLDCHSMPPKTGPIGSAAVVFGDRHGTSIHSEYVDTAVAAARRAGFTTACNTPYAGGYITARHGRPDEGVHALQLEVDRSLYLDADLRSPSPGFDKVAGLIASIVAALTDKALEPPNAIAAE